MLFRLLIQDLRLMLLIPYILQVLLKTKLFLIRGSKAYNCVFRNIVKTKSENAQEILPKMVNRGSKMKDIHNIEWLIPPLTPTSPYQTSLSNHFPSAACCFHNPPLQGLPFGPLH
jgi:hypothetical protein